MNREIKFRGKRLDNGKWVFGDLLTKHPHHKGLTIVESGVIHHEVDPETVGQYTGLKDKNGVKVFEGDLFRDLEGQVLEVVYDTKMGAYGIWEDEGWLPLPDVIGWYTLVGNRWDNRELLEVLGDE